MSSASQSQSEYLVRQTIKAFIKRFTLCRKVFTGLEKQTEQSFAFTKYQSCRNGGRSGRVRREEGVMTSNDVTTRYDNIFLKGLGLRIPGNVDQQVILSNLKLQIFSLNYIGLFLQMYFSFHSKFVAGSLQDLKS